MGSRKSTSASSVNLKHRSTVAGFPPPHTVDWDVSGQGEFYDERGYYTLETAHQIEGGEWIVNQDRKRMLDLPLLPSIKNLPEDYMRISRWLELPSVNIYRFKLPVLKGTKLSYLEIGAPHRVYELTDGTIEVEIVQNLDKFIPAADIKAYFTKAEEPELKAVSPLQRLDESKLETGNRGKVQELIASAPTDDEGIIKAIAQKVKNSHLYSITSPNMDRLNTLNSAEELVDIVAHDALCSCDTCSAQAALETTLGQTDDQFVNVAFGYLNMVHALEDKERGYGGFLRGDTRHAYMLTNRGMIVDPTPSISNGDEATERYLEQLRKSTSYEENKDGDIFFGRNRQLIDKKYSRNLGDDLNDYFSFLGVLAGFGLINGLYFGSRFMNRERRGRISQTARNITRKALLSPLTEGDLELAYSFFPWISFGGGTEMRRNRVPALSKEELLGRITENTAQEFLEEYKRNPTLFEKRARIRIPASLKIRYIANFLQS